MAPSASWLSIPPPSLERGRLDQLLRLGARPGLGLHGPLPRRPNSFIGSVLADGLLSGALWGRPPEHGAAIHVSPPEPPSDGADAADPQADSSTILPDAVVNSFRDSLDEESLRFIKHGPRTPAEHLAFAQSVGPGSHLSAMRAPDDQQSRFREQGVFDAARYFLGPDRFLYGRGDATVEPAAFRLRRAIENAVGGYHRPDVGRIIETSFPNQVSAPERSLPSPLRQLVRDGGAPTDRQSGSSTVPSPTPQPSLEALQQSERFRHIEKTLGDLGLTGGAAAFHRFLDRSGKPIFYGMDELRRYDVVRNAEQGVIRHFVDWMTEPDKTMVPDAFGSFVPVDTPFEQLSPVLRSMNDGQTLVRGTHWIKSFEYSKVAYTWDLAKHAAGADVEFTPDADLYAFAGEAILRGDGNFSFTRKGNMIEFNGLIHHQFNEPFNFEPEGKTVPVPAGRGEAPYVVSPEEGMLLQDSGLAKPFRMYASWHQRLSGTLRVEPDGSVKLLDVSAGEPFESRRRGSSRGADRPMGGSGR